MKLFVYGTLRDGMSLSHLLPHGERHAAWLWGYTLFEYAGGAYPVMMEATGKHVIGEVVDVADLDEFVRVHAIETGAGYEAHTVNVRTVVERRDGSGLRDVFDEQALAYVFPHVDDDGIGAHVESGDWVTHKLMAAQA